MPGAPPHRPSGCPPHNLPREVTSFVGRERALAALEHRLRSSPLVTVTGAGGVGKSRLARRLAARVLPDYPDGVWLAELAPMGDAASLPQAVAAVLGVREAPDRSLTAALTEFLRPRRLLLVLDNCEHLVDACGAFASAVLRVCPELRLLATSRAVLRVSGEHTFMLPPLTLPDAPDRRLRPQAPSVEDIAQVEAVRLFVERAQAADADFALTPANAHAVVAICRRLDGLPLALELAAARVRSLPPAALRERLECRLPLLTGGARDAPARHHTLHDTIGWSYHLLTAPEQALFARLAVFAGGWTLEAAEAVCGADEGPRSDDEPPWSPAPRPPSTVLRRGDVLDALTRLVDQSLVGVDADGEGRVRYRYLETLREYAGQRLEESGQGETFRQCHVGYFLALVEAAAPRWWGPGQRAWLEHMERELDNCRAALRWLLDHPTAPAVEQGLRLIGALFGFWLTRGPRQELRSWLAAFLTLPGPRRPTVARAQALNQAAVVAHWFGDTAALRGWLEECEAIVREAEDPHAAARALRSLGDLASRRGNPAEAAARLAQSLTLFRRADDDQEIARTLSVLGSSSIQEGDFAGARRYLEESLAVYRRLGDLRSAASQMLRLGNALRAAGAAAAARPLYEEALGIWQDLGYEVGIAGVLNAFGEEAAAAGDTARAAPLFAGALARYRSHGFHASEALVSRNLARLAWVTGDTAAARARLAEALGIWRHAEEAHRVAETLEVFAGLAATHGQPARALHLAGAAAAARDAAGRPLGARRARGPRGAARTRFPRPRRGRRGGARTGPGAAPGRGDRRSGGGRTARCVGAPRGAGRRGPRHAAGSRAAPRGRG